MVQSTSDIGADVIPEPDHRRSRGLEMGSRKRQQPGSRDHREHTKIDYSDPFVRALLSPVIIGRMKEILAEGD